MHKDQFGLRSFHSSGIILNSDQRFKAEAKIAIIAYGSNSKAVPSHCLETPLLGSMASSQSSSMKRLTQSLLSLSSSKKKKPGIYYNLTLHTGSPMVCTVWSCSQWRKS